MTPARRSGVDECATMTLVGTRLSADPRTKPSGCGPEGRGFESRRARHFPDQSGWARLGYDMSAGIDRLRAALGAAPVAPEPWTSDLTPMTPEERAALGDQRHESRCPTCGSRVEVVSSDEGTSYYQPARHADTDQPETGL
jgi:hypothetical protein